MKNPWAMTDHQAALARLDDFVDEADGFMRLYLIRYDNKEIGPAVMRRDPLAMALAIAISGAIRQLKNEETPRRCLSCTYEFTPDGKLPHAFMIWVPRVDHDHPEHLMAQPVCDRCCAVNNDRQLLDEAMLFIKQMFPDTEEVREEIIDE